MAKEEKKLSDTEKQCLNDQQMITDKEANIRQVIGFTIFIYIISQFVLEGIATWVHSEKLLVFLLQTSLMFLLTAKSKQCSCILKGKWRVEGGKTRRIPLTDLGKKLISTKKKQLFYNMFKSSFLSVFFVIAYLYIVYGNIDFWGIQDTKDIAMPVIAVNFITLALGYMS